MWYTLDQENFTCFTAQKGKKVVITAKHRKPCAQTQEYPKYTQTAMEKSETFTHKHKSIQNKHTGKCINSLMLLSKKTSPENFQVQFLRK